MKKHLDHSNNIKTLIDLKDEQHFKLWCEFDALQKEFKLICRDILRKEISREMLKGFAQSYLQTLNKTK